MKKFNLSLVAVLAMSTFSMAGGDVEPVVEPVVEVVAPVADDSGFYLGLAYGMANYTGDIDGYFEYGPEEWERISIDVEADFDTVMFQAGYKINKYFAVEGRYWNSFSDGDWTADFYYENSGQETDSDSESESFGDFEAWGVYVKPMYPVTEAFDVYALLGYGNVEISADGDSLDESGFQWGLGASYAFTDNLSVFADYVYMYNDDSSESYEGEGYEEWKYEDTVYTVNFGLSYKF